MADETTPEVASNAGPGSESEIMREAIERLRKDIEAMRGGRPPNGAPPQNGFWRAIAPEWLKPSGIVALTTLFAGFVIGGMTLYSEIKINADRNRAQDVILTPMPRLVERLSERMDVTEAKQRELLILSVEWRKIVDGGLRDARDTGLEARANKSIIDGYGKLLGRLSEIVEGNHRELSGRIGGLAVDLARLNAALEARGRDARPFAEENQIWKGPPYPPIIRVRELILGAPRRLVAEGPQDIIAPIFR